MQTPTAQLLGKLETPSQVQGIVSTVPPEPTHACSGVESGPGSGGIGLHPNSNPAMARVEAAPRCALRFGRPVRLIRWIRF